MAAVTHADNTERATLRASLIAEHLPKIVDDALAHEEIATGIARAGLDRESLRAETLADKSVIAPADGYLDDLVTFKLTGFYRPLAVHPVRVEPMGWVRLTGLLLLHRGYLAGAALFFLAGAVVWFFLADPPRLWAVLLVIAGILGTGNLWIWDMIAGRVKASSKMLADVAEVALVAWQSVSRENCVVPYLRRVINEHLEPLLTLIESFAVPSGSAPLSVTMSAPVHYDPREFVLHLFARVCRAVLREHPAPRWVRFRRTRAHRIGEAARAHLDTIQFLQSRTSGWSGKVTLARADAGWSRTVMRERRAQTYPELVDTLRGFLAECAAVRAADPAVIIAIDELDKIETAERAQQFLNEIKSVFGAPGTLFLVSVSEDALASFERRGLPMRDAFDSAFHDIVLVDYLRLRDTTVLLNSRVIGLPEPFVRLAHCLSGGLPRDVVRVARAMVAVAEQDTSLDEVCAALIADDLARKGHAFQIACRGIGDAPEVTEFIRQLRALRADAPALLAVLPAMVPTGSDGEPAVLRRQAAAYLYYCATLLETFTRERDNEQRDGGESFDTLARAKQSLAVHPRLSWLLVDEFRAAWGFDLVPAD